MYKYLIIILVATISISCKKKAPNLSNNKITIATTLKKESKNAEIVFCLDATGSMSGLIGTAKEKIWDIVSELAQNNEIDTLKMGIVFYRDRQDAFVTKQINLSTDLDEVYSDLLSMEANGGGDTPESVNQALHESVNNMKWSTDKKTYRTIFIVGDCPPHMDYQDDIKYTVSCIKAAEKGIVINTIKLGSSCKEAIYHFKKISICTNGEFLQLDQNATDTVIETPYDDEINKISKNIDNSKLYYGSEQEQSINYKKKAKSIELYNKSSITANSARAKYKLSKTGRKSSMGTKEIIDDYKKGKVEIDKIKENELPKILKGKTIKEKKEYLEKLQKERDYYENKLQKLNIDRNIYIKNKQKESLSKDTLSFSREVISVMKKQAKKK